jgi:hypothetical protein
MDKKKAIIAGLIVLSFILMIVSVIFYIDKVREQRKLDPVDLESMAKEAIIQSIYERHSSSTPFYYFIPIFAFCGIAIGALMYYILSGDLEKKEKLIRYDTEVILRLLDPEERKVLRKIVENNGKISQMEVTYMEGFTKVRSHRVIEGLVQKGILFKEKMGKMRLVKMNKEFYEILKKTE